MKKLVILLLNCLSFALLSGCNDDFLERYPKTEISKNYFFKTEQDLESYIYSLYDFPGLDIYVSDQSTDNAATTGSAEIKSIMTANATAANITAGWDWEQLRNINYFLDNFRNEGVSADALNHYEGIARFFRAKFYFEKVKRYSDVPWYNRVLETNSEELYKTRDPRTLVVDSIFADLDFATNHIKEDIRSGSVNKWVVLAYKARIALYEGTYRKYHPELDLRATAEKYIQLAEDAANKIITEGRFSIYNTGKPNEDYSVLFNSTTLENNPEIILGNYHHNNLKNSGWWAYMFGNYEVSPARDLLQSYLMIDGSFYTSQTDYQTKLFVEEFNNRDPRLYQTYAYPGFVLVNTSTYSQGGGLYVQQLQKNFSGYHQIKGFINKTDQDVQRSIDVPVIRLAEILLIYAEAKAELGALTQADLDKSVNKLRTRAGMPYMSMIAPTDAVQEARYPGLSSATAQWKELLEIRRERRIELALEGFRFDDLMRWGAGKLIEKEPEGLYFPGTGKYDLTGDGIEDIKLIPNSESIPTDKEKNSLGTTLIYYRVGPQGSDASVYISDGNGGTIVTDPERGSFVEPKYYYRPIPQTHVVVNPNLKQIFGW